jgi:hypothetical protein
MLLLYGLIKFSMFITYVQCCGFAGKMVSYECFGVCSVAVRPRVRRYELRTKLRFFSVSWLRNKNSSEVFKCAKM